MKKNPLEIVEVKQAPSFKRTSYADEKKTALKMWDQKWDKSAPDFDPDKNCAEQVRIQRTCSLIDQSLESSSIKKAIDLGCGYGKIALRLASIGIDTEALDASEKPLVRLRSHGIHCHLELLPKTLLKDDAYDLVICTDVIAYLPKKEFRLLFAELARIVQREGDVIVSSPIDINSEDALNRFVRLAGTEFNVEEWVFSYHFLWIKFKDFLSHPTHLVIAASDEDYRKKWLEISSSIKKKWIILNIKKGPLMFWKGCQTLVSPLLRFLKSSTSFLLFLEKVSKAFWQERAISHAIFLGKRRPLLETLIAKEEEKRAFMKKRVWE